MNKDSPTHFKGKDAIGHVVEAQAQGLMASAEIHGTEMPGDISAGADAARETAVVIVFLWIILALFHEAQLVLFLLFTAGWIVWKAGRSALLGWARLERLHRVLAQEKFEIEHNRQQERSELKELYRAKGFEGKLLEDVLDVLMADDNRLLKVMVEEELGLSLESHDHPLKQAVGAFIGCIAATVICLSGFLIAPIGILWGALITIALAAALSAYKVQNRVIPSIVWNIGVAILSIGTVYFLSEYLRRGL